MRDLRTKNRKIPKSGTRNSSSSNEPEPPSGEMPKILSMKSIASPVHAIEPVKKHFLREDGTLAQAEELEDGILRTGHMHWLVVDGDNPSIEIDGQLACSDRRFAVVRGRADDRLNGNCVICFELGQARAP